MAIPGSRLRWLRAPVLLGALAGSLCGLAAWGAYDGGTALVTSTAFCSGACHEMQVATDEYRHSIHYSNASGVRAECADCHVPKPFIPRIVHMIGATRDLLGHVAGIIATPALFETHRAELAGRVWQEMAANGSMTCRSCHSFAAMDFAKQRPQASQAMHVTLPPDQSCIDCHKGVTHRLPIALPKPSASPTSSNGNTTSALVTSPVPVGQSGFIGVATAAFAASPGGAPSALLYVSTPIAVVGTEAGNMRISSKLWMKADSGPTGPLYNAPDGFELGRLLATDGTQRSTAQNNWVAVELNGFVEPAAISKTLEQVWVAAESTYEFTCAACHVLRLASAYSPAKWDAEMVVMAQSAHLTPDDAMVLLKWLQTESAASQSNQSAEGK